MTSREKNFAPGAYIFQEGDTGDFAYQLKSGTVEIVKHSPDGPKLLRLIEPGTVFGEMALVDRAPRSASARARDAVEVLEIDGDAFLKYISRKPQTAFEMMRRLAEYARRASNEDSLATVATPRAGSAAQVDRDDNRMAREVADTDAIYDRPASRPLVAMLSLMLAGVLSAVAFTAWAEVDVMVSAQGRLTNRVPNVVVQARADAVVDTVLVERGQTVRKDQVIARLDGTMILANLAVVDQQLAATEQRLRRIALEQALLTSGQAVPQDHGLEPVDRDILGKRLEEYRSRVSAYHTKVARLDGDITANEKLIAIQREQLEAKLQVEAAYNDLYRSQAGSRLKVLSSKDARLEMLGQVTAAEVALQASRSLQETLRADWQAFEAEWSSRLAEEFAAETEKRIRLQGEKRKLERQADHLTVRAPATGVVLDLPSVTDGSVVAEGDPIVTLVRQDVPLIMEIDVDPKDVSDLRLNVPVSIKLDALAFQQYGDLPGVLTFLSEDTVPERLDGTHGAVYRAQVVLDDTAGAALPPGFSLAPGMLGRADMKVGTRRLLAYFTQPILRTVGGAFSEPD